MSAELSLLSPTRPSSGGSWLSPSEPTSSDSLGPGGPECKGPVGPVVPPVERFQARTVGHHPSGPVAPGAQTHDQCLMLTSALSACWVLFTFFIFGLLEPIHPCQWVTLLDDSNDMPAPKIWDKRYARETTKTGSEFYLIRRGAQGQWIGLFPDKSLKSVRLAEKKTILGTPMSGCFFSPMPKLTTSERETIRQAADEMAYQNNFPALISQFDVSASKGPKRFMAVLGSLPAMGGSVIRWTSRSRYRVGGSIAVAFVLYQILESSGAFDLLSRSITKGTKNFYEVWEKATEASESLKDLYERTADLYVGIQEIITPWKLIAWIMVAAFCGWMWLTMESSGGSENEESDHSSNASSQLDTPPVTPVQTPRGPAEPPSSPHMEILQQLAEQQKLMQQQLMDTETRVKTQDYLLKNKDDSSPPLWREEDRVLFQKMNERMDTFRQTLQEDREGIQQLLKSSASQAANAPPKEQETPTKSSTESLGSAEPPSSPRKLKTSADPTMMAKLDRMSQNVSAVFQKKYQDLEEWPEEKSYQYFPVGYRRRVAPTFLCNIYSENKRAKPWFEEWLRARQLIDCAPARELLAIGAALDVMMLDEPVENFINLVNVEIMCKKAYALTQAYSNVQKKEDWQRPQGGSGSKWTSKVQWDLAKRYDPQLRTESTFTVPEVEEEVNATLAQEVQLLKVQQKAAEVNKKTQG